MDIRSLQYFLAVAQEESITAAAEQLHMTQPPLSRALKDLEEELGVQLLIRGTRKATLTEEGHLLRKRASEIMSLFAKTKQEVSAAQESMSGEIYIGAGETDAMRLIGRAAVSLKEQHPGIHYRIISGDETEVSELLDKGEIDFAIFFDRVNTEKYEYLPFPHKEVSGVLMRLDSPLAQQDGVCPEDLWDKPLIISRQSMSVATIMEWMGRGLDQLNIVATYTLLYNASRLVDEGFGYALTVDKLVNTQGSNLCFRPFVPRREIPIYFAWKKYQVFSRAAARFLEQMQTELASHTF